MKTPAQMITDKRREFTRLFNLPVDEIMDPLLTAITRRFSIDIVRLDDWMVAHKGYRDGSLEDLIRKTYGKDAVKFIWENM